MNGRNSDNTLQNIEAVGGSMEEFEEFKQMLMPHMEEVSCACSSVNANSTIGAVD